MEAPEYLDLDEIDKKVGVAIPISEKTDFKTKPIKTKDTIK